MNLEIIHTTLLSLKAHKLRVFLTMIGIIIGITSVVAISTLGAGMKKQFLSTSSGQNANILKFHYTMQEEDSYMYTYPDFGFDRVDMKKLQKIPEVTTVAPEYSAIYSGDNLDVSLDYFGAQAYAMITSNRGNNKVLYGRDFNENDRNQNVVLLSHDIFTYDLTDMDPSEMVGKAVAINGYMYKVIGVLAPFSYEELSETEMMSLDWDTVFSSFVSRSSYNELAQTKEIRGINLTIAEGADKQAILAEAVKIMQEEHPDVQGYFKENDREQRDQQEMESTISSLTLFLMAITAISLLVGGIGVMNIMYVSVTERKREIGIRRAIGAKPRMILLQFLLEAAFITLIGGLLGVAGGYGLSTLLGGFVNITPIMTPQIFLISTSVSVFTGIFFGIIPAISAARMDPIKAIYN
ncbi:putative ABC transport system permease protein [Enterococcus sp. PF1-24]|uniref:ABC transporter permease n=1 Tax=unclassified Enterococcus TaxID=2608891 RepID=UPI002475677F|nr:MULTISPECIES: ABC transporter permease [unclassified Enterococcus]MDH6365745.1 putative ABC transport system permease protein [Enterococcus sp. PFB1-1]MDH6402845.1 putative ABC transport system permease protein [Enterococcus sp. PF1-24]